MILDRTFTTGENEQTVRALISDYLQKRGYKQRESEPNLVYERGSCLGSRFALSTKQWRVTATVQTRPGQDWATDVVATLDIDTTGQMVIQRERNFWEKEIDDLVVSARGIHASTTPATLLKQGLDLEKRHSDGVKWFYWIAGLSVVNSIMVLTGGRWSFLIGLGITQLVDGLATAIMEESSASLGIIVRVAAFIFTLFVAGVFVLFGFLAKRHKWAFIVGMVAYAFDGLVFLLVSDFWSMGFHLFGLYGLYRGLSALRQIGRENTVVPAKTDLGQPSRADG
jgi:hypothetical protein